MNLFDLSAKITLDSSGYDKGVSDATQKGRELSGTIGNGLKTAAKVGTVAITAAAGGISALAGMAVKNFADYEQLVGGVDTLFKDSSEKVQGYADEAYKTTGMSANDYMETVTGFSASLLQSLNGDTEKAADKANQALIDMSDNANKMGTDMESIKNAYGGFAKANFTMLDNLKLGYGGTKEEMERLLSDAEKISGIKYDISSYADIVDAIHVVQDEMGITGTTAMEASTTIEGSLNSAKSAWSNLVTGIANDNADFDVLVKNFAESVGTAAKNILPRIKTALEGIGMLGEQMAPVLADAFSMALESAPQLFEAGAKMLYSIGEGIVNNIDSIIQSGFDLVLSLLDGLISSLDNMGEGGMQIVDSLVMWIEEYSDVLIEKAVVLIVKLTQGIANNLPKIVTAGIKIIGSLATALIENIPTLIAAVPEIISSLVNGFAESLPDIINVGKDIVRGVWNGIVKMAGWIKEKVSGFFSGIVDSVKGLLGIQSPSKVFAGIGKYMAEGLGEGWDSEFDSIRSDIDSSMNFKAGHIDFRDSGIGIASAGVANAAIEGVAPDHDSPITFNLMLPDGRKIAEYMFRPLADYAKSNGTPILNPV